MGITRAIRLGEAKGDTGILSFAQNDNSACWAWRQWLLGPEAFSGALLLWFCVSAAARASW
jgi:hypothetical protein